ncbi:polyamine aminopropyltransferase [Streptomyces sp. NBC_01186]|uniref:polyamine aminopropyltransferase n=1 Tax=Streptomyces sp. NBC_01186 TaxID=2903765 RepID=UPI002E152058|nr:polyamine aminopropyltransferase [Streptomyces sp. NBC_01186]
MIEHSQPREEIARLPVPAGLGRGFVLASVFMCAACGLVYELELVALAAYLIGDSVTQASVVLSVMVFAMGVGSLLAKRLRCCAAAGFGCVEALLALVGGGSAVALYASFAWLGEARIALVVMSFAIGVLIGAEMPLLMTLIQRIREQDPGGALADLFAADYVGALAGGLTFPFLLLPLFGQLTGGLLTGVVNALAGGIVVLWLFRGDLTARGRRRLLAANGSALLLLLAGTVFVGPFERAAREQIYGDEVRVAVRTGVQELVLTGGVARREWPRTGELRFFRGGRLAVRGSDERAYNEALVGPAMAAGRHSRVLILGGGDGLALREVLRHPDVREVTVVEVDPGVVRLAREDPGLRALNGGSLEDPRAGVETEDAFSWLRRRVHAGAGAEPYDVVLSGLPDPGTSPSAKLCSQEFYGLVARVTAPDGRLAVQAGSPSGRPRDFWTVEATLRAAGLRTCPYAVDGAAEPAASGPGPSTRTLNAGSRTGRQWGFLLAHRGRGLARQDAARCSLTSVPFRAARRAERGRIEGLPPSTLTHPRYPAEK